MFCRFFDMHSGGGCKEPPYEQIYIEAPEEEAKIIFYNKFGHSPDRVSCTCCGEDYAVYEDDTLEESTAFDRHKQSLDQYKKEKHVLIITKAEITSQDRKGTLPTQGYVWVD